MVIVPRPCVWIFVRATTAFPERPGPSTETNGRQAKSPTGCRTGLFGGIRILSLMSFKVISPLNPPGFTNANGYTTLVKTFFLSSSISPIIRLNQLFIFQYVFFSVLVNKIWVKYSYHSQIKMVIFTYKK